MRWRLGAVLLTASALAGGCGALEGGTDAGSAGPEPAAQEWGGDGGITVQVVGEEVPETARRAPDEFQIPESETSPKTDAAPGEKEEEPPDGDPVPGLEADPKTGADQAPAAGRTSDGAGIMESEESRETGDAQSRLQGEEAGDREILDPALVYPGEILEEEDVKLAGEEGFFAINPIDDYIFGRMDGSSYREGCPVAREDLRYLLILHYDFSGNIRVGELVCHKSVSEDMKRIFLELYKAEYPIEKVALVDDYGGDDDWSSRDNNTSCFNYRTVAGSNKLSLHGLGVAIDVNPLYNPYITWNEQGEIQCAPQQGAAYMDRSLVFPYKIDEDDLCCRLFIQAGFTWGGSWEGCRDYMHFSRGYRPEG